MKITLIGSDLIRINESNYGNNEFQKIKRVHIIKLDFKNPTYDLLNEVMHLFPKTNRFIIDNKIRDYNYIFKRTEKKYYVMNKNNFNIISFFRKNNKVLFNMMNLNKKERDFFLMDGIFEDVLRNIEVIALSKKIHDEKIQVLDKWNGNCLILNDGDKI